MSTRSLGTHLSLSPMSAENNTTALVEHKSAKTRTREQGDVK